MIGPINPTKFPVASRIVEIQQAAYAVEAQLIDFYGIPQLTETKDQVRKLGHMHWVGAFRLDFLVGLIAWEDNGAEVNIDRLAVDPVFKRQGFGRRLAQSVPAKRSTTVSTGAANDPAISLYLSEGFSRVGSIEVAPGVVVAQFQRSI